MVKACMSPPPPFCNGSGSAVRTSVCPPLVSPLPPSLGQQKPEVASGLRDMPRLRPLQTLVQPISPASTALTDARTDRMGVGCGVSPQCRETFEKKSSGREVWIYATPPLDARGSGRQGLWWPGHGWVGDGWTLKLEREKKAGRCVPLLAGSWKGTDRSLPAPAWKTRWNQGWTLAAD